MNMKEENNNAPWSNITTNLIVIKSKGNSGKTTTIWMLLYELINQGAKLNVLRHVVSTTTFSLPSQIPDVSNRHDFVAELTWLNKRIVLLSHGDTPYVVKKELDAILPTKPDFIVCTSRSQWRTGSTWDLFETRYTNIHFRRICFWSEYATHSKDQLMVKEPTIKAIIKYIKP